MDERGGNARQGKAPWGVNVPVVVSIALGLLLGGILLSLLAQSRLLDAVGLGVRDTAAEAVGLAKDRIDHVKGLPPSQRREAAGTENYGDIPGHPGYTRTTSLRFDGNECVAAVTVFWDDGRGSVRLEAVVP